MYDSFFQKFHVLIVLYANIYNYDFTSVSLSLSDYYIYAWHYAGYFLEL